jgi:hypothetical protein
MIEPSLPVIEPSLRAAKPVGVVTIDGGVVTRFRWPD